VVVMVSMCLPEGTFQPDIKHPGDQRAGDVGERGARAGDYGDPRSRGSGEHGAARCGGQQHSTETQD